MELAQISINGTPPREGTLDVYRDGQGLLNWLVDTSGGINEVYIWLSHTVTVEVQTDDSYRWGHAFVSIAKGCECRSGVKCLELLGDGPLHRGRVW
jgi:hypothetical protein